MRWYVSLPNEKKERLTIKPAAGAVTTVKNKLLAVTAFLSIAQLSFF